MAVQGTFYRTETQRLGTTPVSPPQAVDDPVGPVNPPGSNPVHDPVTLGTPANGLSLVGQQLSIGLASSGVTGVLSGTDWDIFNNKVDASTLLNYQPISEKGQPNGYVPLDAGAKISETYLPDSITGQVEYIGTWNASTNSPTLANPPASTTKGHYYITTTAGTQFGIDFNVGDWIISDGSSWAKVDNTDAVTGVFGRLGNILAVEGDYQEFYPRLSQTYANPTWIGSLAWSKITGTPTTLAGYGITDAVPNTRTVTAGAGLTGGGALSANITISHADTSSQASVDNSNGTVIQDITLDTYGHITGLGSVDLDSRYARLNLGSQASMEINREVFSNGIYSYNAVNTTTNKPAGLTYGSALNFGIGAIGSAQILIGWTASDRDWIGFRSLRDTTDNWWDWKRIYHDNYHPNADTLTTPRTINGTSFDGSANITTANWGSARTITIGGTGKSVDGSANVSWSLAEIGAASNTISILAGTGMAGGGTLAADRTLSFDTAWGDARYARLNLGVPASMEINREVLATGIYSYNATTPTTANKPSGLSNGSVLTWGRGIAGSAQLAIGWTSGDADWVGFRSLRDTTDNWWSWKRIFHDNYHPNADTWTTARTLTIGSTGKSVNGSGDVSWSLAEIGAQPAGSYALSTTSIIAGTGLTGGGNLSADRTLSVAFGTTAGTVAQGDDSRFHNAVTIGTANGLSLSTQVLSLALSSSSTTGALSSTDWNTFNSKIGGSISSGQIAFGSSTNTITGSSQLTHDSTNRSIKILGTDSLGQFVISNGSAAGAPDQTIIRNNLASSEFGNLRGGNVNFLVGGTTRWSIISTGILQSNGAQTIQSSTGNLTLATGGGNGNIRITPNGTGRAEIQGNNGLHFVNSAQGELSSNIRQGDVFDINGWALSYRQNVGSGAHRWFLSSVSGTSGGAITLNQLMELNNSGNLLIGTATELTGGGRLQVNGTVNCDDPTADRHAVTRGWANSNLGNVIQTNGTWTPSLSVSTGTNPTVTYVAQNGFWVKTGSIVHFRISIQWSAASGGSGSLRINLPSTLPSEDNVPGSGVSINRVTGIPFTDQMVFSVRTDNINIAQIKTNGTYENINASSLQSSGTIYISGFYTVL